MQNEVDTTMLGTTLIAVHLVLVSFFATRILLGIPYIYPRYLRYKLACGDRNAQTLIAGPPIGRVFSMVLSWVIITVLGLLGAYAYALKHDKWRFFLAYTRMDMDNIVSQMAAMYDMRRGSK